MESQLPVAESISARKDPPLKTPLDGSGFSLESDSSEAATSGFQFLFFLRNGFADFFPAYFIHSPGKKLYDMKTVVNDFRLRSFFSNRLFISFLHIHGNSFNLCRSLETQFVKEFLQCCSALTFSGPYDSAFLMMGSIFTRQFAGIGLCNVTEVCDGASDTCPADAVLPANTPCVRFIFSRRNKVVV